MEIASGMSKDISDHRKTCHGFSVVPGKQKSDQPTKTGKSEVQQMNKTGKSEKQRTDVCDHIGILMYWFSNCY